MTHIKGFDFYGVPAAHNEIERDEHGNLKYMGYIVKFGKWTLYHSGDTLWYVRDDLHDPRWACMIDDDTVLVSCSNEVQIHHRETGEHA
ncbi:MAG: hypothetical protein MUF06_22580, partial [Pirellulaceae bacterium]|nr:hypothetical protein [Pirellulaceae bacterium]